MIRLLLVFWAGLVSSFEQQYYDPSGCSSSTRNPGSRYTCNNGSQISCQAFLLYRASSRFGTIFRTSWDCSGLKLIEYVHWTSWDLIRRFSNWTWKVLVPIICSCLGEFYQANVRYFVRERLPLSEIACGVFDGLVKQFVLVGENLSPENPLEVGSELLVPIKCACPSNEISGG